MVIGIILFWIWKISEVPEFEGNLLPSAWEQLTLWPTPSKLTKQPETLLLSPSASKIWPSDDLAAQYSERSTWWFSSETWLQASFSCLGAAKLWLEGLKEIPKSASIIFTEVLALGVWHWEPSGKQDCGSNMGVILDDGVISKHNSLLSWQRLPGSWGTCCVSVGKVKFCIVEMDLSTLDGLSGNATFIGDFKAISFSEAPSSARKEVSRAKW